MRGERLAGGALAGEGGDRRGLRGSALGGDLVLGGGRFQLFELQLHLIEQARRALRARPVELTLELGDLQLLARDGRRVVGLLARASATSAPQRSAASSQCRSANPCGGGNHRASSALAKNAQSHGYPARRVGMCEPGYASRSRRACRPAVRPISRRCHSPPTARRSGRAPAAWHRATGRGRHARGS